MYSIKIIGINGTNEKKQVPVLKRVYIMCLYSGLYKLIMLVSKHKHVQLTTAATICKYFKKNSN